MAYCIVELQTNESGATATPPLKTKTDKNEAMSTFLMTAAAAATSSVACHVVLLIDETGQTMKREIFQHLNEEE